MAGSIRVDFAFEMLLADILTSSEAWTLDNKTMTCASVFGVSYAIFGM